MVPPSSPEGRSGRGRLSAGSTKRKASERETTGTVVGWREWVALPGLGIELIKAKVDTGARTSSLHAYDIRRFRKGGRRMVRFRVHPFQRDFRTTVLAEAELLGERVVRSSSGAETLRPVVVTDLQLQGRRWAIEVTLVRRDAMGFRLLLGRQAIRGGFVVDPGRSFVGGTTPDSPLQGDT